MSNAVLEQSDVLLEPRAVTTEPSGRDWAQIGIDLATAFLLIALYAVGMWAIVVLVEALA
jgi:hypothetical protein